MVVLVGGSSTGKTRACWEALALVPDGWRLWHPIDPCRPDAALAEMQDIGPRTVVWLNEAQHYLLTPAAGVGERVAAGLRELLRDPDRKPVLVLGTIWPEYWATLTAVPDPNDLESSDPHNQARELLANHELRVPSAFSDENDVKALRVAALSDPRLAHAVERAEEGQITQYLAGGPALLERYHTAPAPTRAVIKAAIDARRLGLGPALPQALLEVAAEGYLSDAQWSQLPESWFEEALASACRPVRGAQGALTRLRARHGEESPARPHYRLADYLEQYGRRTRSHVYPPTALWLASIDHAPSSKHAGLAQSAEQFDLHRIAYTFYRTLASTGDTDALDALVQLLSSMGRIDEALAWYKHSAEAGHSVDIRTIGDRLSSWLGSPDEAVFWYQHKVSEGDISFLPELVQLLARLGRTDEAVAWNRRVAELGEAVHPRVMASHAAVEGRTEDALVWYQHAAEAGDSSALRGVAVMMVRLGRVHEALELLLKRADAGDVFAMGEAGWLLTELERPQDAITWYKRAVEEGDAFAYRGVARSLAMLGRADEATRWYHRGSQEAGDPYAFLEAQQLGDPAPPAEGDALCAWRDVSFYHTPPDAAWLLAVERGTHARPQVSALPVGDDILRTLLQLCEAGHQGGTFGVLRTVGGDCYRPGWLDETLTLLRKHRLINQAAAWCRSQAASGSPTGDWWGTAHLLLKEDGQTGSAEQLRRYGWTPESDVAQPWESPPPVATAPQDPATGPPSRRTSRRQGRSGKTSPT
ncbi:hypothetical protein OHA61_33040 [Streptomyces sp. NBC_00885]|uniref:tetratricopeptide repeat protein n=1 Tax=Streptomyces sp. NBC_00885 TaxID=2975857 RepID=UPI00386F08A1|nr:hypothetical protein OHA61_33040 [Streptomyces sp. NBC_00885]